jgi:hypothetical protein
MNGSTLNKVRDALGEAGGEITDSDHGWSALVDDVLRRQHRIEARYTSYSEHGLTADVVLHSGGRSHALCDIQVKDDCINLVNDTGKDQVVVCVTTGIHPLVDVSITAPK